MGQDVKIQRLKNLKVFESPSIGFITNNGSTGGTLGTESIT